MHIASPSPGPGKDRARSAEKYKASCFNFAKAQQSRNVSDAAVHGRPPGLPHDLEAYLTTTRKPHQLFHSLQDSRSRRLRLLLRRFTNQILYGCKNPYCNVVTCLSYRKRNAAIPVRPYNEVAARALAWRCVEEYADPCDNQFYGETTSSRKKGKFESIPSSRPRLCWNEPVVPWYEDPVEAQRRTKNVSYKQNLTSVSSCGAGRITTHTRSESHGPEGEKEPTSSARSPNIHTERVKTDVGNIALETQGESCAIETAHDEHRPQHINNTSSPICVSLENASHNISFGDIGQDGPIMQHAPPPKDTSSFTQMLYDTRSAKNLDQLSPLSSRAATLTRSLVKDSEPSKPREYPVNAADTAWSIGTTTPTLHRICTFRILPLSAIIWLRCAIPPHSPHPCHRGRDKTGDSEWIRTFARQSLHFCLSSPLTLLESVQTWRQLPDSPLYLTKENCLKMIGSLVAQEKKTLSSSRTDLPQPAGIVAAFVMLISITSVSEVIDLLFAALQHAYVLPSWMKKACDKDSACSHPTSSRITQAQIPDLVLNGEPPSQHDIDSGFLDDDQVAKICILVTWVLQLTSGLKMSDHLSHPEVRRAKNTGGLFAAARNSGTVFPHAVLSSAWNKDIEGREKYQTYTAMLDAMDDWGCLRLVDSLADVISHRLAVGKIMQTRRCVQQGPKRPISLLNMISDHIMSGIDQAPDDIRWNFSLQRTLLDLSRTVLLRRWNREAIVKKRGPVGGALELLGTLYRSRIDFKIRAADFAWKFVAGSFDEIEMPVKWLEFREDSTQTHILSYSFLFEPAVLVKYFRAINSATMRKAHESASFVYANARQFLHTLPVTVYGAREVLTEMRPHMARFFVLTVRRNSMLKDAIDQIWRRQRRELTRPLKVRLGKDEGEDGLDHGGVQQEFFRLVFAEALSADFGMFTIDERTKMIWFQPGSYEPLYKYEALGILMSLAVYNGVTLPVTFPLAFYRRLLGLKVKKLEHIADGWPDLAKGFQQMLDWEDGDVGDVIARTYEFSYEAFGTSVSVDMTKIERDDPWPPFEKKKKSSKEKLKTASFDFTPNYNPTPPSEEEEDPILNPPSPFQYLTPSHSHEALNTSTPLSPDYSTPPSPKSVTASIDIEAPLVTNDNRDAYVKDYIYWLTTKSISSSFSAFATGFYTCLDRTALSIFTPEHLKTVIEGYQHIDIDGLQSTTTYEDYHTTDETIRWFWQIVRDMSPSQHKKLLEFVTASDRVPVNGIASVTFIIQKNGEDDERLPSSSTCYGRLLLPNYSKKEILKEKLEKAIENSIGFGIL